MADRPITERTLLRELQGVERDSRHADEIVALHIEALSKRVEALEDARKRVLQGAGAIVLAILCDIAVRFVQ